MDFFGAQDRARHQSRLLTWGFAGCVLGVVLVLDIVVLSALRISHSVGAHREPFGPSLAQWATLHPGTVLLVSLVAGGFIGAASMFRMMQLRDGGGYVARNLGGVRVERSTPDPRRRMLHNVVEEMALAAGMPVPEVYVLEQEEGVNAFAAGHTPANAVVAVTRGALQKLNRDQLQGVIAHEFSHILNGDMRLSMRLTGLVFGLMALATAGRMLIRFSAHGRRSGAPVLLLGFGVAAIGQTGFWAGRFLQAWISRKRECLADASAVQFTRNPDGIRDALIRAAAFGNQPYTNASMEEVAHMLFFSGRRHWLATHPPLLERVQALDPHVNQAELESMLRRSLAEWERSRGEEPVVAAGEQKPVRDAMLAVLGAAVPASAALITSTAGDPEPRHLEHAVALRKMLPDELRGNADDPEQAQALMLALLVFADPSLHERQLELITTRSGAAMAGRVRQAAEKAASLPPILRLPAVLQLFPALRTLLAGDRLAFIQLLQELMRMDGRLSVFDYALEKLVTRGLGTNGRLREPHGRLGLEDLAPQLGVVFMVLAKHGASDPVQARQAYEAGMAPLLPRHRPAYSIMDDWATAFDRALEDLCALQITAKQLLIEGLVRTIAHDDMLAVPEAELLRAICAVLECPLPPVLFAGSGARSQ
jgi:Zn-dependent protease with chaperone function